MKVEALILEGTAGLVQGERIVIGYGRRVSLGRSHTCDLCLTRAARYRALPREEREKDRHFRTISRLHLKLHVVNSAYVELENVGRHGSFLDGEKFDSRVVTDIREKTHSLRLGSRETFLIKWGEVDETETKAANPPRA
jgi:hypothetical protein